MTPEPDGYEEFRYWWMFPTSILIAIAANQSGIGGAAVFGPIFVILFPAFGPQYPLKSPAAAVGTAIFVEIFGFSSGIAGYLRRNLIDAKLGLRFAIASMPATIIASLFFHLPIFALKVLYSIIMLGLGIYLLLISQFPSPDIGDVPRKSQDIQIGSRRNSSSSRNSNSIVFPATNMDPAASVSNIAKEEGGGEGGDVAPNPIIERVSVPPFPDTAFAPFTTFSIQTQHNDNQIEASSSPPLPEGFKSITERINKKVHVYRDLPISWPHLLFGTFGGIMTALIGVGLGEVMVPRLLYLGVPIEVASAAGVFTVALTCAMAAIVQFTQLIKEGGTSAIPWSLIAFMVPGVVIGAQIGTYFQGYFPKRQMQRAIGIFFFCIGCLFVGVTVKMS